jgi:phenylalanine-4-hydroxylase
MTESTHAKIPHHLRRYIVEQNYERYSSEDQAVWRYIMRQLKNFLGVHAHESYLDGLVKTGITVDRIPRIEEIDEHLERFGWGAVPVSGFIPPAAFMEFQSIGVLPIASDMRTLDHLLYTPAPDIVHEAAGHAPILVHPEYSAYLRQYGEVARHSILTKEDMDQYEAIRLLSDIKEDPRSTPDVIAKAEARLSEVNRSLKIVSEAALLGRMNWWTAEYGLIGDLSKPKIFGAGLLSSVGESRHVLDPKVKKIPLSVDCVDYSYDITEPQPQLFVTRDFAQLGEVLEDLAKRLSYRRGGTYGLDRAKEARTVNTVVLNSGIQISGVLADYLTADGKPVFLKFNGPSQLGFNYLEIHGQGTQRHPQGFSSPVGKLKGKQACLSTFSTADLEKSGIVRGERSTLEFESGVKVSGILKDWTYNDFKLTILTFTDCKVNLEGQTLFEPSWGEYDMAIGSEVVSVFGGPADRTHFAVSEDFVAKRVTPRTYSKEEQKHHDLYQNLREIRESGKDTAKFKKTLASFMNSDEMPWLIGLELIETAGQLGVPDSEISGLRQRMNPENFQISHVRECVRDGLQISNRKL